MAEIVPPPQVAKALHWFKKAKSFQSKLRELKKPEREIMKDFNSFHKGVVHYLKGYFHQHPGVVFNSATGVVKVTYRKPKPVKVNVNDSVNMVNTVLSQAQGKEITPEELQILQQNYEMSLKNAAGVLDDEEDLFARTVVKYNVNKKKHVPIHVDMTLRNWPQKFAELLESRPDLENDDAEDIEISDDNAKNDDEVAVIEDVDEAEEVEVESDVVAQAVPQVSAQQIKLSERRLLREKRRKVLDKKKKRKSKI